MFQNVPRHMVVDADTPQPPTYQEVFWLFSKESAVMPYLEPDETRSSESLYLSFSFE